MALVLNDVLGVGLQVVDFSMSYMPTSVPYMPFPAPSPTHQPPTYVMSSGMSVSTTTGGLSPSSAILASVDVSNDPVTKAVMENVMGRLPTKKPRVTVRCEVCNLEFSSQTVLSSHTAGSKHQRKVKSQDLLRSLEEKEKGFERDDVSGVIRCTVCDVTVNSPQLLATHIAGNKHKQRANKKAGGATNGPPAKKMCTGAGVTGQEVSAAANGGSSLTIDIPDCVQKLEETKGGGKYICNPCQAHCNSEQQLAQHLKSRKHLDITSGNKEKKKSKGGYFWRGGRRRPAFRGGPRPRGRGRPISHTYTQPLSSSFVAGGALL
ncbi:zinc finger protein 385D-like isoform X1 [Palaemon carinicauda]|uniref:zinc finger protein 385D-like isoform X1 n=2 Tax=Palaemon carinicauda TaxID=392227 RepID=UPI0035B64F1B